MQHDNLKSTTFLSVNFNLVRSTITRMGDTYEVNSKCTYRTYSEGGIPIAPRFGIRIFCLVLIGVTTQVIVHFSVDQLIRGRPVPERCI